MESRSAGLAQLLRSKLQPCHRLSLTTAVAGSAARQQRRPTHVEQHQPSPITAPPFNQIWKNRKPPSSALQTAPTELIWPSRLTPDATSFRFGPENLRLPPPTRTQPSHTIDMRKNQLIWSSIPDQGLALSNQSGRTNVHCRGQRPSPTMRCSWTGAQNKNVFSRSLGF